MQILFYLFDFSNKSRKVSLIYRPIFVSGIYKFILYLFSGFILILKILHVEELVVLNPLKLCLKNKNKNF